ncbi:Asp-tRNA(Asn)/Glu-tRNA(Gln) amidotransferase A subunit family amidase [Stella humosa]|uniref:Asp-tRNA(Asn)/Glu-tRNA(Gln) amidotransferase A subunit family amidase n=1 Tax=Stella humosa TaxID=94 RepID=A0A3N1KWJ1_9PROT|nr:amidase [Stella humosa]ROP83617.1 Asp-tRNA(Asn)/Glu-tRNA(Gln) amidotransferase A subunit family amidase [Stella humosa]BBK33109.1 amidase [Stella humosa]
MAGWNLETATAVRDAVAAGEVTALAVADDCIAAIAARDGELQSFVDFDAKAARKAARTAPAGPLSGITVGVKDIIDADGWATQCNSPIYAGHRPNRDSAVVGLLRAAGATILGKTVTVEFAFAQPGPTVNPYHPGHTPGGSSSGSAAAVAARLVHVALGTQTGGSVIRPGSYCGIFALKPSFGLIPREGVKPLSESLDTIGWYGRSVADLALVLSVFQAEPVTPPPQRLRIGLCLQPPWSVATGPMRAAIRRAARRLEGAGHIVAPFGHDALLAPLHQAQDDIMSVDAARSLRLEKLHHLDRLSPRLQERIRRGEAIDGTTEREARRLAEAARRDLDHLLGSWDAILTAPAPGEAPEGLGSTGDAVFNKVWTLLGVPCVNIPVGRGPKGLPLGIQLIGRRMDDARLLAVAASVADVLEAEA